MAPYMAADGKHLMPVIDVEEGSVVADGGTVSDWVNAFGTELRSKAKTAGFDITPMIYTGASNAGTLFDATIPLKFPLWVVQWPSSVPSNLNTAQPSGVGDWQSGTNYKAWGFWSIVYRFRRGSYSARHGRLPGHHHRVAGLHRRLARSIRRRCASRRPASMPGTLRLPTRPTPRSPPAPSARSSAGRSTATASGAPAARSSTTARSAGSPTIKATIPAATPSIG